MIRALAFLGAMAVSVPALAHGDASWIQHSPQGWCCGVHDCAPAPAGEVVEVDHDTWRFRGVEFKRGDGKTFQAQPHERLGLVFWFCQPAGYPPKCLFYPERFL